MSTRTSTGGKTSTSGSRNVTGIASKSTGTGGDDPNRVPGMPILHHSISGKTTGAVSNWLGCKAKWSPYLESQHGKSGES